MARLLPGARPDRRHGSRDGGGCSRRACTRIEIEAPARRLEGVRGSPHTDCPDSIGQVRQKPEGVDEVIRGQENAPQSQEDQRNEPPPREPGRRVARLSHRLTLVTDLAGTGRSRRHASWNTGFEPAGMAEKGKRCAVGSHSQEADATTEARFVEKRIARTLRGSAHVRDHLPVTEAAERRRHTLTRSRTVAGKAPSASHARH